MQLDLFRHTNTRSLSFAAEMRPQRSAFLIIYHIHFIISKTGICMIRINPIRIQKYFIFIA